MASNLPSPSRTSGVRRRLRRGAFGGSLTTLIITIAAIALAAFVITMLWPRTPVTLTVDTQSSYLRVEGNNVILYLRVTVSGDAVRIYGISLTDDNDNEVAVPLDSAEVIPPSKAAVTADYIQLPKDVTVTLKFVLTNKATSFYEKSIYEVTIDTDKVGTKIVKVPKV